MFSSTKLPQLSAGLRKGGFLHMLSEMGMPQKSVKHPVCPIMPCAVTATWLSAGSQIGGFLRFLHLLSAHPWRERALVVDPNDELAGADREAALALHSRVSCAPHDALPSPFSTLLYGLQEAPSCAL